MPPSSSTSWNISARLAASESAAGRCSWSTGPRSFRIWSRSPTDGGRCAGSRASARSTWPPSRPSSWPWRIVIPAASASMPPWSFRRTTWRPRPPCRPTSWTRASGETCTTIPGGWPARSLAACQDTPDFAAYFRAGTIPPDARSRLRSSCAHRPLPIAPGLNPPSKMQGCRISATSA